MLFGLRIVSPPPGRLFLCRLQVVDKDRGWVKWPRDEAGPLHTVSRNERPVIERETSLRIDSAIIEIERVSAWLEEFAIAADVPDAITAQLLVAVDEILNNIIRHGVWDGMGGTPTIGLDLCIGSDKVALTVTDDGQAFDPTIAAPAPDKLPACKRPVGGVGLLFVQSLMDEMHYLRSD